MQSKSALSSKRASMGMCFSLLLVACLLANSRAAVKNAASTGSPKFVQVSAATAWLPTSTVVVSYPLAQTAGDLNIVVVGWNDTTATVKSVADTLKNTYALAAGPTKGIGLTQSIYYAKNIPGGSNTITVTFSQKASYPDVRILEYKGLSATAPLDVTANASGTSGSNAVVSSGSATTTSASELIFGAGTTSGAFSQAGPSFTAEVITEFGDIAEDEVASAKGSHSATATLGNNGSQNWVMQMAGFKPSEAPIQHTVALSWKASSSKNITSYNVYRSTISGGYYGLVGSTAGSLSYRDDTVQAGTTYYYVTTAVNNQGEQSGYSNQVVATVPSP